jgi:hypothetical protein
VQQVTWLEDLQVRCLYFCPVTLEKFVAEETPATRLPELQAQVSEPLGRAANSGS